MGKQQSRPRVVSRGSQGLQARHPRGERGLLVIDQEPLRKEASAACRRTMKALEKARAELSRFTDEDQPTYARWMSASFGPVLTEARGLHETLTRKFQFLEELEVERALRGGSRYSAYYAVTHRRDSPPPPENRDEPEPEPEPEEFEDSEETPDPDEAGKEGLFHEFVRATFGVNPRALPRKDYEALRSEFYEAMFGEHPSEHEAPRRPRPPRQPPSEGPLNARIKEKYRWLVRQLHPDTRTEKRPDLIAIWHEVQKAYMARDLERLETLAALVELREGLMGAQTSLFQARAALGEMKSALRALTRSLKDARNTPMWRFSLAGAKEREVLRVRIGMEIRLEIDGMKLELARLEKVLAGWSTRPPERQRGRMKVRARDAWRTQAQGRFGF